MSIDVGPGALSTAKVEVRGGRHRSFTARFRLTSSMRSVIQVPLEISSRSFGRADGMSAFARKARP